MSTLKRINVTELRLGMYVHEFCGSWLDHPFWCSSFLLDKQNELETIRTTGITEVWIDTAKGLDIEGGSAEETVAEEVEETLETLAHADIKKPPVPRADVREEAKRAAKICARAKEAVTSMFQEARMGQALVAEDALPIVDEITSSVARNPGALISMARLKDKDDYTYMHSVAVCGLMVALSRQLRLDDAQTREAGLAGLLHDLGKMMIPPEILNKPGKLTDAEFDVIKNHPAEGHRLLLEGEGVSDVALDVCLHHHEKVDGSGYPENLTDEQISLYSKMGAVCDVYDAITSNRPYKNGWEPAESIRKMAEWSKGHFDRRIFEAFVRSVGIYPVGQLVRLQSDKLAVVVEQSEQSLLVPRVMAFFSICSNARITPQIVDLARPDCKDKIISHEDPAKWGINDIFTLWSGIM